MKKILCTLLVFAGTFCFANEANQYEIDFIKGNMQQKTQAVLKSTEKGNSKLCIKSLDFVLDSYAILKDDKEFLELAVATVDSLKNINPSFEQTKDISLKLNNLFKSVTESNVRFAVLDAFEVFPSFGNVSLINAYVAESSQKALDLPEPKKMDSVTRKSIELMKSIGNATSFNILFSADLMGIWQEDRNLLEEVFGFMANDYENDLIGYYSSVDTSKKEYMLSIIHKNKNISKKIKGKIGETALSEAIYTSGGKIDSLAISADQIQVQLTALQMISDTQWTRASVIANDYFQLARIEYEKNLISASQFANIITNISSVASTETCQTLSYYLDFLNRSMESNNAPVEAVVLSVINSLGGLGDKSAFDYLLYVTYLDYSEAVTNAARNALVQLKW